MTTWSTSLTVTLVALVALVAFVASCGGAKPSAAPTAKKIDCEKLTDHLISVMAVSPHGPAPADASKRRADALAQCPAVWHADNPTPEDIRNVDCLLAAQTVEAMAKCDGPTPGSAGAGSGS